ncbi:MAG: hypothetical protein ACRD0J_09465 [Acidimicrobiales bacterium]
MASAPHGGARPVVAWSGHGAGKPGGKVVVGVLGSATTVIGAVTG